MPEPVKIRIENEELQRYLNQLADKTSDLRPLMKNIAGIMADSVEENFEQQGRPKWEGLKKPTIERRVKKGYWPGKILQMRGELVASITSFYDSDSAVVGTNKLYAAIHQFGGKAGRGKQVEIPARPFLRLGDEENAEILTTIITYLNL